MAETMKKQSVGRKKDRNQPEALRDMGGGRYLQVCERSARRPWVSRCESPARRSSEGRGCLGVRAPRDGRQKAAGCPGVRAPRDGRQKAAGCPGVRAPRDGRQKAAGVQV